MLLLFQKVYYPLKLRVSMATPQKAIVFKSKYTIYKDDRLVVLSFMAPLYSCWSGPYSRCMLVQSDIGLKVQE